MTKQLAAVLVMLVLSACAEDHQEKPNSRPCGEGW